jgi:hypothetical protein
MFTEDMFTEDRRNTGKKLKPSRTIKLDAQYLNWSLYTPPEILSNNRVLDNEDDNYQVNSEFNNALLLTNNITRVLHYSDYQYAMQVFNQSFIDEKGVHLFVQRFFEKFNAYIESARKNALHTHIHHFSTDIINKLKIIFSCLLQHIVDRQHHQWYLPNEDQSPALVQYLSRAYDKTQMILLLIESLVPSRQLEYQAS